MSKNLVLTGFMGIGKSVIGRSLANSLNMQFVDTDDEIEKEYNMTISEIFDTYGEATFRKSESELVRKLCESENKVISTGGGVVKSKENMDLLKKNSVIINLHANVDKIISNIGNTDKRPLLRGKNKEEIQALINEREEFYKVCNARIDTSQLDLMQAVKEVENVYNSIKER